MVSTVPVLVGPTASGKTTLSILIARELGAEIISADSRQVYRFMDIGTAKPTGKDRRSVPHYFIDELTPDEEFSAGSFGKAGRKIIAGIMKRRKVPLVVGGSGLYVRSIIDGLFEGPSAKDELRTVLEERMRTEGPARLLEELRAVDPLSASKMLPTNTRRIIRALEVYHLTGKPISKLQQKTVRTGFTPLFAAPRWERAALYERIDRRVDLMIEDGLLDEALRLREMGYSSNLNALQTVGYKEAFEFLDGKYNSARMVELIKQNSRRYAKRQLTWFRRDERIRWFDISSEAELPRLACRITEYFRSSMRDIKKIPRRSDKAPGDHRRNG